MKPFAYQSLATRVLFGEGQRDQVVVELEAIGASRALLIAPQRHDLFAADLDNRLNNSLKSGVASRISSVVQHVPLETVQAGEQQAKDSGADSIVSIGGGSAIGLSKAIARRLNLPQVVLPTTFSGSEMTPIWGETTNGHKTTGRDNSALPRTVIYDPALIASVPREIAGPSGMNAIAHCVEAMYGPGANPVTSVLAVEGARILVEELPGACLGPDRQGSLGRVFYGAHLAGMVLATAGTALHHRSCHVLGGMFGLDHGQMNSVVLGHALRYCEPAIAPQLTALSSALKVNDVPSALFDLAKRIGAPTSLEEIGMSSDSIHAAAEQIVIEAAANVPKPTLEGIQAMLGAAFAGTRP